MFNGGETVYIAWCEKVVRGEVRDHYVEDQVTVGFTHDGRSRSINFDPARVFINPGACANHIKKDLRKRINNKLNEMEKDRGRLEKMFADLLALDKKFVCEVKDD